MKYILLSLLLLLGVENFACTNLIVTKGASSDGSTMLFYTNDGEFIYHLLKQSSKDHKDGELMQSQGFHGFPANVIPEVKHSYATLGFQMNEFQVAIGETTFGGRKELHDKTQPLKYWNLMYVALQRSKTALEAIKVITDLCEEYGYGSSGESISIIDPNEAWILEIIGTGGEGKSIWIARKIPDGCISAHANMARIGEFPLNDNKTCLYSENIIKFAVKKGYYNPKENIPFNFREIYDPASISKKKYCATRVWSIFRRANSTINFSSDYHRGIKDAKAYPLWIKPDKKLSIKDVKNLVRDHYEGTEFDMTTKTASGAFKNPNRGGSLLWNNDSIKCSWERPISTPVNCYSIIAQCRNWLPNEIGGLLWFSHDDIYTNCYSPIYNSVLQTPKVFRTGDISKFDRKNSSWWAMNFVSNYANINYKYMIKDIKKEQDKLELEADSLVKVTDHLALKMLKKNRSKTIKYLTDISEEHATKVIKCWNILGDKLVVKYINGYIKDKYTTRPKYSKKWIDKIYNKEYEIKENPDLN